MLDYVLHGTKHSWVCLTAVDKNENPSTFQTRLNASKTESVVDVFIVQKHDFMPYNFPYKIMPESNGTAQKQCCPDKYQNYVKWKVCVWIVVNLAMRGLRARVTVVCQCVCLSQIHRQILSVCYPSKWLWTALTRQIRHYDIF